MRLLYQTRCLMLETNLQLEKDLEAHSTLHLRGTGCPDCETVAASVIQFHEIKKELDFRHCEGCVHIITRSVALLQLTGYLVALRSCHHAKVKRKGARWHKIRKNHICKMDHQLSLATSLSEAIDIRHIAVAEPGWQGCLSRPRRSRPLLFLNDNNGFLEDFNLIETLPIRANDLSPLKFCPEDFVSELVDAEKWILPSIWLTECIVNTSVVAEGTASSLQLIIWQRNLNRRYHDAIPMAERLWKGEEWTMSFFVWKLAVLRAMWAMCLATETIRDAIHH